MDVSYKTEDQIVDPELAATWLAECMYEHQRPVRQEWVQAIAAKMSKGQFRPGTEITFCNELGKGHKLVNGQHTLLGLIMAGVPQRLTVREYATCGPEQTAWVFSTYDMHRGRTITDVIKAYSLGDKIEVATQVISRLAAAVAFIHNGFKMGGATLEDKLQWAQLYADEIEIFWNWADGSGAKLRHALLRAPTMAVALVTIRHSSLRYGLGKVEQFWKGAIFDDSIPAGDGRKHAHNHLITTVMTRGGNGRSGPNVVSQEYSARYLARAFNSFIEGVNVNYYKIADANAPICILGTPYNGKA